MRKNNAIKKCLAVLVSASMMLGLSGCDSMYDLGSIFKLNDAPFLVGHSGITSSISYSQSYYI